MTVTMERQDPKDTPVRPVPSRPPPSGVMLRGAGRISLVRRTPAMVLCTIAGQIGRDHTDWALTELALHAADGARDLFIDASRLDAGGTLFKQRLEDWLESAPRGIQHIRALRLTPPGERLEPRSGWIEYRDPEAFQVALLEETR